MSVITLTWAPNTIYVWFAAAVESAAKTINALNPDVKVVPEPTTSYEEGCLSFPEIRGDVVRPDEITVKFQDVNGVPHTLRCNGLLARCVLHEHDHLQGILFIDRMAKDVLEVIDPELKALKKQTRESAKKS